MRKSVHIVGYFYAHVSRSTVQRI